MVLDKMISLVIIVFTVGIALQAVGLRAQALFVSSLGGLAISFASKDILANFVSGILIISQGRCEVRLVQEQGGLLILSLPVAH